MAVSTPTTPRVIGNHVSPFVRKVLAVCRIKGMAVEVDPIVPFFGNERFTALSPLRRIPVFVHGDVAISDSSVIAEYLEDLQPTPSVLPGSAVTRARNRWLDEFADTRLTQVFLWGIFAHAVVKPGIFGTPRDLERIAALMRDDVPAVMDSLEKLAPAEGFVAGDQIGLGDLSIATQFANLRWSRQSLDPARWPRTLAWIARVEAHDALKSLTAIGDIMVRRPPAGYRDVLQEAGVALSTETVAADGPPRRVASSQA